MNYKIELNTQMMLLENSNVFDSNGEFTIDSLLNIVTKLWSCNDVLTKLLARIQMKASKQQISIDYVLLYTLTALDTYQPIANIPCGKEGSHCI